MKALKRLILAAILGLAFYLTAIASQSPESPSVVVSAGLIDGPRLLLVAPPGPQPATAPIDVQVIVTGTIGLAAFEFDLVLDRSLLEVGDLSVEPLLGGTVNCEPATSRCAFSLGPMSQPDVTGLGGYSYGTGGGTASEGTLAILHLDPTGSAGTSTLYLANPRLADVDGNLIVPEVLSTTITLSDTVSVMHTVYLPVLMSQTGTTVQPKAPSVGRISSPNTPNGPSLTTLELALSARLLDSMHIHMTPVDGHLAVAVTGINPDVNGDGITDIVDIQLVAACWGMAPTDPGCSDVLDLNSDQIIDEFDIDLVVARWKVGLAGIERTSPAAGENAVAITRETIIAFTEPLDPATVTQAAFWAEFGGQVIPSHLLHSSDGKRVTLFYDQGLPASARVRVSVEGDLLQDTDGYSVDPNGDGFPGGLAFFDFDTLSLSPVPGTEVWGYAYDSYNQTPGGDDIPVVGATISVDGLPGISTVTDADGYFILEDTPAPGFFVHIDGSTATSAPAGTVYATVGKLFHSILANPSGSLWTVSF